MRFKSFGFIVATVCSVLVWGSATYGQTDARRTSTPAALDERREALKKLLAEEWARR